MAIPHIVGGENAGIAFSKINGAFDMLGTLEQDLNVVEDQVRRILAGGIGTGGGGSGIQGPAGATGKSAYQIAIENGFSGTQAQWIASLKGVDGNSAYQIAVAAGYPGNQTEWLASLKGPKGDKGDTGPQGPAGSDAPIGTLPADIAALKLRADQLQAQIESIELGEANLGTLPDEVETLRGAVNSLTTRLGVVEATLASVTTLSATVEANRQLLQAQIDAIEVGETNLGTIPQDVAALKTAVPLKANRESPVFTGNPTAPTKIPTDNSDSLATTRFVRTAAELLQQQIARGTTVYQRVVTPEDDLAAIINELSFLLPKSTSDNARPTGLTQVTRLLLTPGTHRLFPTAVVTFDGLQLIGSGVGSTEIVCEGGSALQIGQDAATSAGCYNPKGLLLSDFTLTVRGNTTPQWDVAKDGDAGGWPRGVMDIRFFTWSVMERVYIKNYTNVTNSGGMYLSGYQWSSFNNVHVDGFGRYCVCLDSQSPETWEVQLMFANCQFMQGNTYDTDVSAAIYFHSTNRFRSAEFSALGVTFDGCHFALYPMDGNYTRETRSIYIDPTISGVDFTVSCVNHCLFESHLRMIDIKSDVVFMLRDPTMYGNGRTIDAVAMDNWQVKYLIDSPVINGCENGIMSVGRTVVTGNGKITGVPGTKVRMTGNLRMAGEITGLTHDYREPIKAAQIPDGTTSVVVPISLADVPIRFEIAPTWNTSCWVSEVTAASVRINFSTPAPVGPKEVFFYCSCAK